MFITVSNLLEISVPGLESESMHLRSTNAAISEFKRSDDADSFEIDIDYEAPVVDKHFVDVILFALDASGSSSTTLRDGNYFE